MTLLHNPEALGLALAEMALEAGGLILPYWRAGTLASTKADASPVTIADHRAEALILERLAAAFPDIPVVAEEAAAAHGLPSEAADRFFLVDPLDGTRGFVAGRENFTVNIALIEDGLPVAGAVVAPALDIAWRTGEGAWRKTGDDDWAPIRTRPLGDDSLALLSNSAPHEECVELSGRHGCKRFEGVESSIKFCRVAEGAADAYPRTGPTSEWDTAAGHAVLRAAGGRVATPDGHELRYGKPGFLNGPFVALGDR